MTHPSETTQPSADRASAPDDEIGLIDLALVLARYKKRIAMITIAGAVLSVVASLQMANVYTGVTRILPPQQGSTGTTAILAQLGGLAGGAGGLAAIKNPNDLYVGMLKSRTLQDALIKRFDLKKTFGVDSDTDARLMVEGASDISAGKDGLIVVQFEHSDPKLAADVANAYIEELYKLNQNLALTEASQRRLFYERHLKAAKENLAAAEVSMRELQERSGLLVLDQQARASIEAVAMVRAQIAAKEVQIQSMRAFATSNNPDLKFAEQELASLRAQLAKMKVTEPGDILVPAEKIPGQGLEYLRRMREVKYAETIFEVLAKQFELARIEEGKNASLIQVLDAAVVPEKKSKPKRTVIVLISTLASLILAVASSFVSESLRRARLDPHKAGQLEELRRFIKD